jgi:hypothetical protein
VTNTDGLSPQRRALVSVLVGMQRRTHYVGKVGAQREANLADSWLAGYLVGIVQHEIDAEESMKLAHEIINGLAEINNETPASMRKAFYMSAVSILRGQDT